MSKIVTYLYIADIINGCTSVCIPLIALGIVAFIATTVALFISSSCDSEMPGETRRMIRKYHKTSIIFLCIVSFLGIISPSPRTIYVAAGEQLIKETEMGQIISDDMKSILQDVKTIIHKQAEH